MSGFDELGIQLTDLLAPWIAILISISAAFWFKDFATNLMIGLKYRTNSHFNEGDHYVNGVKHNLVLEYVNYRKTMNNYDGFENRFYNHP